MVYSAGLGNSKGKKGNNIPRGIAAACNTRSLRQRAHKLRLSDVMGMVHDQRFSFQTNLLKKVIYDTNRRKLTRGLFASMNDVLLRFAFIDQSGRLTYYLGAQKSPAGPRQSECGFRPAQRSTKDRVFESAR